MLGSVCPAQSSQRALHLVASQESGLSAFTQSELRKIFLGIPVERDGVRIRPLLNTSDPLAMSIFLQQVVFMSEREYRRQLLLRVFRQGDLRPPEFGDIEALVDALLSTPGTLTFMWSDQYEKDRGLESLGILWADSSN